MDIFTGFVIGLLGSLHCIGMCGPIALTLPMGEFKSFKFYSGRLLYNAGRVITYSLFGLIFGIIGKNLAVIGLQRWVSVISGALIIIIVLLPGKTKTGLIEMLPFGKLTGKLKNAFGKLFRNGSLPSMLFIGIINGLLPCGFVYVGVAGAVAAGDVLSGIIYMALFGIGTVPVMFITSVAGNFITTGIRHKVTKIIPALAILLAVLFILRGLSLGIPFISPSQEKVVKNLPASQINQDSLKTKDCCK